MTTPTLLHFGLKDFWLAFWQWMRSYRLFEQIPPGLYYTGAHYPSSSPMLVTCNYHLTVFLLWWRVLRFLPPQRILVLDTAGVNVWCASGKGTFSADEILRQLACYPEAVTGSLKGMELILPKLGFSGVQLATLQRVGITPRIGPIYMTDLPAYLAQQPHTDFAGIYRFTLRDRLFTLPPSTIQIATYLALPTVAAWVLHQFFATQIWWQIFAGGIAIAWLYIVLFPILPSKRFAIKGLWLGSAFMLSALLMFAYGGWSWLDTLFAILFVLGGSLFFGLYYTGNSGVSNYSIVKYETLRYLPISIGLLIASMAIIVYKAVQA